MFEDQLGELLAVLDDAGCHVRELVAPGGRAEEAAGAFPGLTLPVELMTWFRVLGLADPVATSTADVLVIAPDFELLTLARVLEHHRFLVAEHGDAERSDQYIPGIDRLVPIARLGWRTHLAEVGSSTEAPIRLLEYPDEIPSDGPRVVWPSMSAMVDEWLDEWRAGRMTFAAGVGVEEVWEEP